MIRTPCFWNTTITFQKILFLFCSLLSISVKLSAQTPQTITNTPSFTIKDYKVLPDAHYSFNRILTDASLPFANDSLKASTNKYYWIKIILYNPYPNKENYVISLAKAVNYTLYYVEPKKERWVSRATGLNVSDGQRQAGIIHCVLQSQAENIFYLKIDLRDMSSYSYEIKPAITLEKEIIFASREEFLILSYLICCIALISFSCYNLYIYFHLKDKVYLHYVFTQLGALMYLSGERQFVNIILPLRIYNLKVWLGGNIDYYTIGSFFMHVGVALIFWGLSQFTRSYLRTKELLPAYDKALKILSYMYVVVEMVPSLATITGLYFWVFIQVDNLFILMIIATCITSGIVAYKHKIKTAKHFLAAILLPTLFAAGASIYILEYDTGNPLLPALAILSQILTFAVALVARIKLINEDLNTKAIEAIKLEAANIIIANERLLMEQENKIITLNIALEKERNIQLQNTLDANQRELVGNSLYIHQKNRLLADLKTKMQDIDTLYPDTLKGIQSSLNDGRHLDEEWDKFKLHFEQVHPSFFANLQAAHPVLTKYELRLYAYFHINLSTKEIAALLNIAPASVRQAKTRLNKKMSM